MAESKNILQTLVYIVVAIILIAIALRVIAWVFNLALHLVAIFFSLIFLVALIYVIYIIFRGAFSGK